MFSLNNTFPNVGALTCRITVLNRAIWEKLGFKDFVKERMLIILQSPDLFCQQRVIELTQLSESHISFTLWFAQLIPTHPTDLTLLTPITPPKLPTDGFNLPNKSFRKFKTRHSVCGDRLYHCFNKYFLACLRQEVFLPTLEFFSNLFFYDAKRLLLCSTN